MKAGILVHYGNYDAVLQDGNYIHDAQLDGDSDMSLPEIRKKGGW